MTLIRTLTSPLALACAAGVTAVHLFAGAPYTTLAGALACAIMLRAMVRHARTPRDVMRAFVLTLIVGAGVIVWLGDASAMGINPAHVVRDDIVLVWVDVRGDEYVLDTGLTMSDCLQRAQELRLDVYECMSEAAAADTHIDN